MTSIVRMVRSLIRMVSGLWRKFTGQEPPTVPRRLLAALVMAAEERRVEWPGEERAQYPSYYEVHLSGADWAYYGAVQEQAQSRLTRGLAAHIALRDGEAPNVRVVLVKGRMKIGAPRIQTRFQDVGATKQCSSSRFSMGGAAAAGFGHEAAERYAGAAGCAREVAGRRAGVAGHGGSDPEVDPGAGENGDPDAACGLEPVPVSGTCFDTAPIAAAAEAGSGAQTSAAAVPSPDTGVQSGVATEPSIGAVPGPVSPAGVDLDADVDPEDAFGPGSKPDPDAAPDSSESGTASEPEPDGAMAVRADHETDAEPDAGDTPDPDGTPDAGADSGFDDAPDPDAGSASDAASDPDGTNKTTVMASSTVVPEPAGARACDAPPVEDAPAQACVGTWDDSGDTAFCPLATSDPTALAHALTCAPTPEQPQLVGAPFPQGRPVLNHAVMGVPSARATPPTIALPRGRMYRDVDPMHAAFERAGAGAWMVTCLGASGLQIAHGDEPYRTVPCGESAPLCSGDILVFPIGGRIVDGLRFLTE